jgi:hypothetical protein
MSFRNSPMQAQRGSRGTTPPILNFGAKWGGWSTSHTGKSSGAHCAEGVMGPKVSVDGYEGEKMSCPYRVSNSISSIPRSLVVPAKLFMA